MALSANASNSQIPQREQEAINSVATGKKEKYRVYFEQIYLGLRAASNSHQWYHPSFISEYAATNRHLDEVVCATQRAETRLSSKLQVTDAEKQALVLPAVAGLQVARHIEIVQQHHLTLLQQATMQRPAVADSCPLHGEGEEEDVAPAPVLSLQQLAKIAGEFTKNNQRAVVGFFGERDNDDEPTKIRRFWTRAYQNSREQGTTLEQAAQQLTRTTAADIQHKHIQESMKGHDENYFLELSAKSSAGASAKKLARGLAAAVNVAEPLPRLETKNSLEDLILAARERFSHDAKAVSSQRDGADYENSRKSYKAALNAAIYSAFTEEQGHEAKSGGSDDGDAHQVQESPAGIAQALINQEAEQYQQDFAAFFGSDDDKGILARAEQEIKQELGCSDGAAVVVAAATEQVENDGGSDQESLSSTESAIAPEKYVDKFKEALQQQMRGVCEAERQMRVAAGSHRGNSQPPVNSVVQGLLREFVGKCRSGESPVADSMTKVMMAASVARITGGLVGVATNAGINFFDSHGGARGGQAAEEQANFRENYLQFVEKHLSVERAEDAVEDAVEDEDEEQREALSVEKNSFYLRAHYLKESVCREFDSHSAEHFTAVIDSVVKRKTMSDEALDMRTQGWSRICQGATSVEKNNNTWFVGGDFSSGDRINTQAGEFLSIMIGSITNDADDGRTFAEVFPVAMRDCSYQFIERYIRNNKKFFEKLSDADKNSYWLEVAEFLSISEGHQVTASHSEQEFIQKLRRACHEKINDQQVNKVKLLDYRDRYRELVKKKHRLLGANGQALESEGLVPAQIIKLVLEQENIPLSRVILCAKAFFFEMMVEMMDDADFDFNKCFEITKEFVRDNISGGEANPRYQELFRESGGLCCTPALLLERNRARRVHLFGERKNSVAFKFAGAKSRELISEFNSEQSQGPR